MANPARTPELIVALDVPDGAAMRRAVATLGDAVDFYKVGLELFCAEGPAVLDPLRAAGKRIFLDLKLHDIPRTVARAVAAAARHGVALLTLHAGGGRGMLAAAAAAAQAAGPGRPRLVAVTVLTSLDAADLRAQGIRRGPGTQVPALGALALEAGLDGIVCSPREARAFRRRFGPDPLLVTPGIRPPGADVGDQKRVATPAAAAAAGATHLVVGRPVLEARDPRAAAESLRRAMAD